MAGWECKNVVRQERIAGFLRVIVWRGVCITAGVAGARHFRELTCWQLANELKLAVYRVADSPAVRVDPRFREQLVNAAASAPRNIAEGFGRRTHLEFAKFLDIARGSLMECQNHLQDAVDRGYLTPGECATLESLAQRTYD